jgi:hypothetical protein
MGQRLLWRRSAGPVARDDRDRGAQRCVGSGSLPSGRSPGGGKSKIELLRCRYQSRVWAARLRVHARAYGRQMAERSADDSDPGTDETTDDRPGEAELSADVIAARRAADAQAKNLGAAIDAQIEVVLANCRIALDALATKHAYLADHSDLDLDGGTRWAARWQLAAAAIAYANALVDLSARGYVDVALPVSRSLHEALGVLGVINDDAEQTILARWLANARSSPRRFGPPLNDRPNERWRRRPTGASNSPALG